MRRFTEEEPVTKKSILNHLGSIYDPFGMLSPTTAEGKCLYREACDEKKGWITEILDPLKKEWTKWTKQLRGNGHGEGCLQSESDCKCKSVSTNMNDTL